MNNDNLNMLIIMIIMCYEVINVDIIKTILPWEWVGFEHTSIVVLCACAVLSVCSYVSGKSTNVAHNLCVCCALVCVGFWEKHQCRP